MESLYLLVPLSVAVVLAILAVFGWALERGQFDDLDGEAERILIDDANSIDVDQGPPRAGPEQSSATREP